MLKRLAVGAIVALCALVPALGGDAPTRWIREGHISYNWVDQYWYDHSDGSWCPETTRRVCHGTWCEQFDARTWYNHGCPGCPLHAGCACDNCQCGKDCKCNRKDGCKCDGCKPMEEHSEDLPTGVDWDKVGKEPKFSHNGKSCDKDHVMEEIEKRNVDDESRKRRIIVIGPETERKAALAAIGKPDWAVVNAYDPHDWQVDPKRFGYVTGGSPTVYIMEPDGKVLHRQDDMRDLELALRKADPAYDPTKDPDLRVQSAAPNVAPWIKRNWYWLAAAGIGLLLLRQRMLRNQNGLAKSGAA